MTIKNYSKQCLMISAGIMVLALLLSLFGMGINVGIDFSGGMSMQYTMGEAVTQSDIEGVLNGIGLKDYAVSVQGTGKDSINIRIKAIDEDGVQGVQASITEALQAKYPNAAIYGDVNYVGPVAGATLLRNAFLSVLIAALCMLIYIAIRFDFNSGAAAVLGLVHDVLIMLSFMVILRSFVQMNSSFIAAMLTIVGYSINNTIIIFDRIRENARKMPSSTPRVDVVNRSIKECLGRTINTTLTTLVTIVCLYIFGVSSIREFALPIIVGALLYGPGGGLMVGLVGAFLGQLMTYGVTATTVLWIIPPAVRGLLIGLYAKRCGYELSRKQLVGVLIVTSLVVTLLNTGAIYLDSVIYGYYTYAYVFGKVGIRIVSGAVTAVAMAFVTPPVLDMLKRSLRAAQRA